MMSGLVFKAQGLLLPVLLLVMLMLQSIAPLGAKPTEKVDDILEKANSQPVYELQLTAWPSDMDDMAVAMAQPLPIGPVIEEPIVVMPEMDDEYDEDSYEGLDNVVVPVTQGTQQDDSASADVLVNYHKTLSNGTAIYKLLLSNGMANYQRMDLKTIKGKLHPVQQGYYTVPLATNPISYQTVHYRADENGYNVYRTDQSPRNPAYDFYLEMGREEAN